MEPEKKRWVIVTFKLSRMNLPVITDLVLIFPSNCFHLCLILDNKKVHSLKSSMSAQDICALEDLYFHNKNLCFWPKKVKCKTSSPRIPVLNFHLSVLRSKTGTFSFPGKRKSKYMFFLLLQLTQVKIYSVFRKKNPEFIEVWPFVLETDL